MLQSNLLLNYNNIEHYFFDKNDSKTTLYKRIKQKCLIPDQIHSDRIQIVENTQDKFQNTDGLVSLKKVYLGIQTADCLPILLYSPAKLVISAIHAGWRGLLSGIIYNTIFQMKLLGVNTHNMIVVIGPHIRSCCYVVDKKIVEMFTNKYLYGKEIFTERKNQTYLDLSVIAKKQMLQLGIDIHLLDSFKYCTFCDFRFFSYRRDKKKTNRMLNVIGLKKSKNI